MFSIIESPHDKTNKITCAPSEDSDQQGRAPSLIWVFAVRMKKLSYPLSTQQKLWSDWADTQADLSLRWAHRSFCWFLLYYGSIISFHQTEKCKGFLVFGNRCTRVWKRCTCKLQNVSVSPTIIIEFCTCTCIWMSRSKAKWPVCPAKTHISPV